MLAALLGVRGCRLAKVSLNDDSQGRSCRERFLGGLSGGRMSLVPLGTTFPCASLTLLPDLSLRLCIRQVGPGVSLDADNLEMMGWSPASQMTQLVLQQRVPRWLLLFSWSLLACVAGSSR